MQLVGRAFGRSVAVALLGDHVQQNRPALLSFAQIAQNGEQMVEVVAVDRADVIEAEFLEQRPAGQDAAGIFLGTLGRALEARTGSAWPSGPRGRAD